MGGDDDGEHMVSVYADTSDDSVEGVGGNPISNDSICIDESFAIENVAGHACSTRV
jgi:hypothetical protein